MSERFDDLLSGAVDSASRAAREPGADAARKRGRQRRNRQRLAASTLSLALLGAVGGVAAVSVHGTNTVPAAHASSSAAVTVSASPGTPASPSASASPSATVSSSPSASTAVTTARSAPVAGPDTYVPAAWLSPQQMPLYQAGTTEWAYDTYNYGTHLGGHVYKSDPQHIEYWCSDSLTTAGNLTSLENGLSGAQYQSFTGPNSDGILPNGTIPAFTMQVAYFYPDAEHAAAAMNGLAGAFAGCATAVTRLNPTTGQQLTGSTQQTAAQPDAQCWSLLAVGAGKSSANDGTLDHACFVRSGNLIEEVHLEDHEVGSFSTQSFTATDAGLIPALRQALAAYGK